MNNGALPEKDVDWGVYDGYLPPDNYNVLLAGVLFKLLPNDGRTEAGLILPMNAQFTGYSHAGIVVSAGPDARLSGKGSPPIKRGDIIIILNNTPIYRVLFDGEQLNLVNRDTMVCVLKDDAKLRRFQRPAVQAE